MICVTICSILQCASPSTIYTFDDLWYLPSTRIAWQDVMTGNTDSFFWWLPLAGISMSVGIVSLLWLFVEVFIFVCAHTSSFLSRQCCTFQAWWFISRHQETRYQQIQRRAITTFVLFMLVATFIPYQFVFVVAFLVHIVTCVRAMSRTWIRVSVDIFIMRL
jgi:hypothetical protein